MTQNYIFPFFLNYNRELKIESLRKLNYISKIGIEGVGYEVYDYLSKEFTTAIDNSYVHHAEFGKSETITKCSSLDELIEYIDNIFYEDKIIFFPEIELYIWIPNDNKFFVIFGSKKTMDKININEFHEENFMEILNDDTGISEKGRMYMIDAFKKYGGK